MTKRNFLQAQRIGMSALRPGSQQRSILDVPRVLEVPREPGSVGDAGELAGNVLAQHFSSSSGAVDVLIACK